MINAMVFAIPAFFIFIAIEWVVGRIQGKKYFNFSDSITNLNLGVGNHVINLFVKLLLLGLYNYLYTNFAFFELGNGLLLGIGFLIVFDLVYYWAHRWSHEWNILWGAHVVHHQSEEYNLTVALRQPWFHVIIAFPLFMPFAFLGVNTLMFGAASLFVTLFQFWVHTKAIKKLPRWFEYIFNTPSHHRVHHAVDPKYIDKNHGAFLIIWDRMFGTFKQEEEEPNFGITTQLKSWNPVWANVHYYVEMWQLAKQTRGLGNKLSIFFRRPGWRPDYLGGYQAPQEVTDDRVKYNTKTSKSRMAYVMLQFAMLAAGVMAYTQFFDELSWAFRISLFGLIVLSTLICGAILENKSWVVYMEHARLLIAALLLNTLYYTQFSHWFTVMLIGSTVGFVLFTVLFRLEWLGKRLSPGNQA